MVEIKRNFHTFTLAVKAVTARVTQNVQSAFTIKDTQAEEKNIWDGMGSRATKMLPLLRTSIETVKTCFTFLFQVIQGHKENADCKTPCTWALEIM